KMSCCRWGRTNDVLDGQTCGKRLQFRGLGELRQQALGVDVQFVDLFAGTQIEIQAAFEALLHKLVVGRNVQQTSMSCGQKPSAAVLLVHALPPSQFLWCGQKFVWWIVALCVSGRPGLRCGNGGRRSPTTGNVCLTVLR